jgi:hypothetical protein
MKLATTPTQTVDINALSKLNFWHSADYQLIELDIKKRAYAREYEQYKKLMEMEEAGITVTVIMTSEVGTITLQDNDQFQPMEYLNDLSKSLAARADEILDLTQKHQQGLLMGDTHEERDENTLRLIGHAICMPATPDEAAQPTTPTVKAA